MPSAACQSEMDAGQAAQHLFAMAASSSMPSFAFTADVCRTLAEQELDEQLEARGEQQLQSSWLRKSRTQCFDEGQVSARPNRFR